MSSPALTGYSQNFLDLMRWRVREVLLVSSQYDSFLFDEDGQLYGLIQDEYLGLSMSHSPEIVKVSKAADFTVTPLHLNCRTKWLCAFASP